MRLIRITAAVCLLSLPALAFAQPPSPQASASLAAAERGGGEWIEYVNRAERFSVNLPASPRFGRRPTSRSADPPFRRAVYTVQDGPRHYSVTVVNLAAIVQPSDVKGSIAWEAWNFRKRGGEVTYDAYAQVDRIEGHQLHITNRDKSLSFVRIR